MSMKPGDWKCAKCSTVNFASRERCRNGCSTRPANAGPPAAKPGDWTCGKCGKDNFANRSICFGCQCPKAGLGTGAPPPASTTAEAFKPGDWPCQCGTINFASRHQCFKCQSPKPSPGATSATPAGVTAPVTKPGDWMCASCGKSNFAVRTECFGCHKPRAVVESPTAPLSQRPAVVVSATSTLRAGDWPCPTCSFGNFGTRTHCLQCGTPRPSPDLVPATTPSATAVDTEAEALAKLFALPKYWKVDVTLAEPQLFDCDFMLEVFRVLWMKNDSSKARQLRGCKRIENVALWHSYRAEAQRLVAKHKVAGCPKLPKDWAPTTLQMLEDDLGVNEVFLMHGTSPEVGKLIVENGFDPSHSGESAGAMFGQGTYFSDSLAKCMGYSKGCIIIARVVLGEACVPPLPGQPSTYRRPPPHPTGSGEFDCVIAKNGSRAAHKEFIVYRHTKAYPEYSIFHS